MVFLRVLYALFALAFAVSTIVQWNDPDPLPWMLVYGAACAVAVQALVGRPLPDAAVVLGLVAGTWALALSPSLPRLAEPEVRNWSMKSGDVSAEEARECGGLAIVAVASLVILMDANARRRRSVSGGSVSAQRSA